MSVKLGMMIEPVPILLCIPPTLQLSHPQHLQCSPGPLCPAHEKNIEHVHQEILNQLFNAITVQESTLPISPNESFFNHSMLESAQAQFTFTVAEELWLRSQERCLGRLVQSWWLVYRHEHLK